jgi:hypothetical protein
MKNEPEAFLYNKALGKDRPLDTRHGRRNGMFHGHENEIPNFMRSNPIFVRH